MKSRLSGEARARVPLQRHRALAIAHRGAVARGQVADDALGRVPRENQQRAPRHGVEEVARGLHAQPALSGLGAAQLRAQHLGGRQRHPQEVRHRVAGEVDEAPLEAPVIEDRLAALEGRIAAKGDDRGEDSIEEQPPGRVVGARQRDAPRVIGLHCDSARTSQPRSCASWRHRAPEGRRALSHRERGRDQLRVSYPERGSQGCCSRRRAQAERRGPGRVRWDTCTEGQFPRKEAVSVERAGNRHAGQAARLAPLHRDGGLHRGDGPAGGASAPRGRTSRTRTAGGTWTPTARGGCPPWATATRGWCARSWSRRAACRTSRSRA